MTTSARMLYGTHTARPARRPGRRAIVNFTFRVLYRLSLLLDFSTALALSSLILRFQAVSPVRYRFVARAPEARCGRIAARARSRRPSPKSRPLLRAACARSGTGTVLALPSLSLCARVARAASTVVPRGGGITPGAGGRPAARAPGQPGRPLYIGVPRFYVLCMYDTWSWIYVPYSTGTGTGCSRPSGPKRARARTGRHTISVEPRDLSSDLRKIKKDEYGAYFVSCHLIAESWVQGVNGRTDLQPAASIVAPTRVEAARGTPRGRREQTPPGGLPTQRGARPAARESNPDA